MTRVKISATVLLILVLLSAFMSFWVNRRCDDMLSEIIKLSIMAENGQSEALSEGAERLNRKWESFRSKASVLLKYDKLVEADRISSRIVQLAENDGEDLECKHKRSPAGTGHRELEHIIPGGELDGLLLGSLDDFLVQVFLVDDDAEEIGVEPGIGEGHVTVVA